MGILTTSKKTRQDNLKSPSNSRDNTTDFITTSSFFSVQNTDNTNCSDTTSSDSGSSGGSCD